MGGIVVIAGGSGLVGEALCHELINDGFTPRLLSRTAGSKNGIKAFGWNPPKNEIDVDVFKDAEYVINLAGENVGKGRWTKKRKKELIESRIQTTRLLAETINSNKIPLKKFIQASAVGYYGFGDENTDFIETDPAGKDFLAQLSKDWEQSSGILDASVPKAIIRIGVVFSNKGGAFTAMAKPVKYYIGSPIGSGKQMVPWIHIQDLTGIILYLLKNPQLTGIYNAVSPDPKTNRELTRAIGKAYKAPVWPVNVPGFVLKLMLGEQAQIVLEGNKVSASKLLNNGYKFKFPYLQKALENLIK